MFKRIFVVLAILLSLPAFAGQYSDALKDNEKVFLYLHTPPCKYCVKFNPIYKNLANKYDENIKFLKINAETLEGLELMRSFKARFVPYVLLIDTKQNRYSQVSPSCLLDTSCMDYVVDKFIK